MGAKVPWNKRSWTSRSPGANVPRNKSSMGAKVLCMDFLLLGTKVQRNEKSRYHLYKLHHRLCNTVSQLIANADTLEPVTAKGTGPQGHRAR